MMPGAHAQAFLFAIRLRLLRVMARPIFTTSFCAVAHAARRGGERALVASSIFRDASVMRVAGRPAATQEAEWQHY